MHAICIHVDENMDEMLMNKIKSELMQDANICNVELNPRLPHDLLVEYKETPNLPMTVLERLSKHGLHSDIFSC